jgi:phosphoglycerate kinase
MVAYKTLDQLDVAGKRVLVRVDLNVPMQDGEVSDATRIDRLVPTIEALTKAGARVVLLSHFGRPKGKPTPEASLGQLVAPLSAALGGRKIAFAEDCIGPDAERVVDAMQDGDVALLENLRFHPGEEVNDPHFASSLAKLGDVYVNDAFSAAHRAHASTEALAHLLPNAAGLLMQAELEALTKALEHPERPVAAIVGGSKVSTKLDLLNSLVGKVDLLIIGGAMANTRASRSASRWSNAICWRRPRRSSGPPTRPAAPSCCQRTRSWPTGWRSARRPRPCRWARFRPT